MATNDQIILDTILERKKQDIAPDLTHHEYFEIFVSEQILKDYDLSYDEIRSGIMGGAGDGGIDCVYLFLNDELVLEDSEPEKAKGTVDIRLYIGQAKSSSGFEEKAIDTLRSTTEDLLDLGNPIKDLKRAYSQDLLAVIGRFREAFKILAARFPKLKITYFYATKGDTANVHPNVQRKVGKLEQSVTRFFSTSNFSFEFYGARELNTLAQRMPISTHTISLAENPISTGQEAFIGLVRLRDYYEFITDSNKRLFRNIFEANVRDYQGDVKVNKAIQETLRSADVEDFWWLNNGVTIIATRASLSGKTLTIEAPQIVNGLQTSSEVFKYFRQSHNVDDNRSILVRVIVTDDPTSRDSIIKATNSQTVIPEASLRSTDHIHRNIEQYLRGKDLYYDRRKNFYKNLGKPVTKTISISYLAQAIMAVMLQQPDYARARPSTLLRNDADYERVFNEKYPIDVYFKCVSIMKQVETFVRATYWGTLADHLNNIKFYMAMVAAILLTEEHKPNEQQIAAIRLEDFNEDLLDLSAKIVIPEYNTAGANDQTAKSKFFAELIRRRAREKLVPC